MIFRPWVCLLACLCLLRFAVASGSACPFCEPVANTLGQDMDLSDVVAIAELTHAPTAPAAGEKLERSHFTIREIFKGDSHIKLGEKVELLYFAEGATGDMFLMLGVDPPQTSWVTPTLLDPRALAYVKKVTTLPDEGAERLDFFEDFLEDENDLLSRDAYDEFARAPYDAVIALGEKIDRQRLIEWIQQENVPASRRRLYFTMLGVCGGDSDAKLLERMMRSDDRKDKSGLDALIACYLRLCKDEGLPVVEELFLRNEKCEYADTYAAIMALRFHGEETDVIPRSRILKSLHVMLERPALADLVIVDLARWEDWSVMDRLVELFKNADEKSSWVRVPVIRYLLACPEPKAKEYLKELEKIDEGAVRRAKTFIPVDGGEESSGLDPTLLPPGEEPYAFAMKISTAGGEDTLARADLMERRPERGDIGGLASNETPLDKEKADQKSQPAVEAGAGPNLLDTASVVIIGMAATLAVIYAGVVIRGRKNLFGRGKSLAAHK